MCGASGILIAWLQVIVHMKESEGSAREFQRCVHGALLNRAVPALYELQALPFQRPDVYSCSLIYEFAKSVTGPLFGCGFRCRFGPSDNISNWLDGLPGTIRGVTCHRVVIAKTVGP